MIETYIITHTTGVAEQTTANQNDKDVAKLTIKIKINEIMKKLAYWQVKTMENSNGY